MSLLVQHTIVTLLISDMFTGWHYEVHVWKCQGMRKHVVGVPWHDQVSMETVSAFSGQCAFGDDGISWNNLHKGFRLKGERSIIAHILGPEIGLLS
jgi:hypothetical protein